MRNPNQTALQDGQRLALSVREAAAAVGVSAWQIRSWCQAYQTTHGRTGLRHARPGARLILISVADLSSFFSSHVPS